MISSQGEAQHTRGAAGQHAPGVTVVIPTYNNSMLLGACLQSLRALNYPRERLQTIVVDNGSSDGTRNLVHARSPEVQVVRLEENSGFAAACNRGAEEATDDYVAFLNDDAVAEKEWLNGLFAGLEAGGEGAVCAASRILSRDGKETEFSGASSNLFGVGRPRSVWGWPDAPEPPAEGSPILFASGGAMLVHRRTFLDAGGFDPAFFAYFEDVDLGWRLWLLGHKVVYAPASVVRHTGGATGSRSAAYKRYTLWECNSLAVVLKNYQAGNMEQILSAAILLLFKRAVLSAGSNIDLKQYRIGGPPDTNAANVEKLPRISVAHLAAIDRFNRLLPHFMGERRRIQSRRMRSDKEILPLLGRPWDAQFAGAEYAQAAHDLAVALELYGIEGGAAPRRVLVVANAKEETGAARLAKRLSNSVPVALALVGEERPAHGPIKDVTIHTLRVGDPRLLSLSQQADMLVLSASLAGIEALTTAGGQIVLVGSAGTSQQGGLAALYTDSWESDEIERFCLAPEQKPVATLGD
ncbi:MAG: glycosyltransferase family 2 protein [Chloroflexota bacterium]|nr:glycosyltransferase family 2 protein [Chloroflexota bacterium]